MVLAALWILAASKGDTYLYLENNGKGVIGFGDGFFVAEFSGGKYKMDISEEEKQEFLQLMGTSQEELFK